MSRKKTNLAEDVTDVDSPGWRLGKFLSDNNILPAHIAKTTNTHASTIASYLCNETSPKKDFLKKLSDIYGLNMAWVDYGVGPMMIQKEGVQCRIVCEEAPTNYEQECLRLKHEVADSKIAAAELREKMGMMRDQILESVRVVCA